MMKKTLQIGHSPDADDAFVFSALARGHVKVDGYDVVHVMEDIESLNRRALRGELDMMRLTTRDEFSSNCRDGDTRSTPTSTPERPALCKSLLSRRQEPSA